jgi:DnaK suppressor protein
MNRAPSLTRQQLHTLRAELESERTRLERALALDVETNPSIPRDGISSSSVAGMATLSRSRTQARYDAIVQALERLLTEDYGACVRCDNPIPYGRLAVMPEVVHCVSCGRA